MTNRDESTDRVSRAYDFISSVNKEAYKDVFLIPNQVLSKNPFSNEFLRRYVKNDRVEKASFYFIANRLLRYYSRSLKHFISYCMEFIEFFLSSLRFKRPAGRRELVLLDVFFVIKDIEKRSHFSDSFFCGLAEVLKKKGAAYAYLPAFEGMKKRLTMYNVFRILKKDGVPVMTEYELLHPLDLVYILCFIMVYPARVLKLALRGVDGSYERDLLKSELIRTLDQVAFPAFSRYLQGRRIARLDYAKIKIISWYENQTYHKALYKGARTDREKVKIYGTQFFWSSRNYLNFIPDENETDAGIVPDKILVNGPGLIPPKSRLPYFTGPSLRYSRIFDEGPGNSSHKDIVVFLPYGRELANQILRVLNTGELKGPILVKPHPFLNMDLTGEALPRNAILTDADTYDLLKTAKVAISMESGTLMEAAAMGVPVISIRNCREVDYNPLPDYGRGVIWEEAASSDELWRHVAHFENMLKTDRSRIDAMASEYKNRFFSRPSEEHIISSFDLQADIT